MRSSYVATFDPRRKRMKAKAMSYGMMKRRYGEKDVHDTAIAIAEAAACRFVSDVAPSSVLLLPVGKPNATGGGFRFVVEHLARHFNDVSGIPTQALPDVDYSPQKSIIYNPRKIPNSLIKLRARVRTLTGAIKNPSLETRAKEHFSTGELNAKMRSKKSFRFWCFFVFSSVGIFFGSHFGVQLTCGKMFLGSRFQSVEDFYSARKGPRPRPQFIHAFPHHSTVAARSARATAASLNRFYWEPTGGRCVFECRCVRI